MKKTVYIIGIGGIGISALARYYHSLGYSILGSDKTNSELIEKLSKEGMDIIIGEDAFRIHSQIDMLIYTEAIPNNQSELSQAQLLQIPIYTYPEALAQVANEKKLITIAGTHGKSTTTSLTSLILKNSQIGFSSIVGTLLKEFEGKNFFTQGDGEYFIIEACEYKRSYLKYKPSVAVITNIEIDHLDYYKDLDDYISSFESYINNVQSGGFVLLNGNDVNCQKLLGKRNDIRYIQVFQDFFEIGNEKIYYPQWEMQVPGEHIMFDAKIAYIIGHMLGIHDYSIIQTLEEYSGVWRRMEKIGTTKNMNILMSDYGHHPTEIQLTLNALKSKFPQKKLITIFQPHQYSRTLELLEDFKNCFSSTDTLIIPDIYESRDSQKDKEAINSQKLVTLINHPDKQDGEGMENTLKIISQYDKENTDILFLLLGAGDVDNLRYQIKTV